MLKSQTSAGRYAWLAAAAVALAFAISFALPHAAFAEGEGQGGEPQVALEGEAPAAEAAGSSDNTPSGGAEGQGTDAADSQQGAGEATSAAVETEPADSETPETTPATEPEDGQPATITVTFSDGVAAITAKANDPVTMPATAKEGYTFKGWADADAPETVAYEAGKSYAFTEDKVLVAVWEEAQAEEPSAAAAAAAGIVDGVDLSTVPVAQVKREGAASLGEDVAGIVMTISAAKQNIATVFAGAAVKGNLVMDAEGTINPDAWWAYYKDAAVVTVNGQTVNVGAGSLLVGVFDGAASKEVYTPYYCDPYYYNENIYDWNPFRSVGYSSIPWMHYTIYGEYLEDSGGTTATSRNTTSGHFGRINTDIVSRNTTTIYTFGGIQPVEALCGWFNGDWDFAFPILSTCHFEGIDTSKCTSLAFMLADHYNNLFITGMGSWNTSNVTAFEYAFSECGRSEGSFEIDLSGWDMTNAVNTYNMFYTSGGRKPLDGFWMGSKSVLEGTSFETMGPGMWYVEAMGDESLADSYVYPGLLIDASGLNSFYHKGGNDYGKVKWRRLGSVEYYTISYNGNGGSGNVANNFALPNTSLRLPPNAVTNKEQLFKREGYRIASWNTQSNGQGTSYALSASITPTGNMTLYAIWEEADGFRVQYDVDGGVPGYADKTSDATTANGLINWRSTNLIPATEPTKAGYTFKGWYVANANGEWVDRSGNVKTSPNLQAKSNSSYKDLTNEDDANVPLILKAYFEEKSVTMTYGADSATHATVTVTDASGTSETKKPSAGFAGATATLKPGYHSLYWTNDLYPRTYLYGTSTFDADGIETCVLSPDQIKSISFFGGEWHDATFTLVTEGNAFTIHFEPNGATVNYAINDISMRYGDVVYLPDATGSYVMSGYLFADWANAASEAVAETLGITYKTYATGAPFDEAAILDGATYTLYARWAERQSTVTFRADYPEGAVVLYDADGETVLVRKYGSTPETGDWVQTIGRSTGTVLAPTAVATDGYRFLYWIDDNTKQVVSTDVTWAPTQVGGAWPEASVYRAKFEPKTYAIAFDATEGTGSLASQQVTFGQTVTLKPNAVNQATLLRAINRPGYLFAGWNTKEDGTGTAYADQGQMAIDANFLKLLGDDGFTATLYAQWSPRPITIRYNAGAADVSNSASYVQNVAHEQPVTLTANQFRRYGYSFAGWSRVFGGAKEFDNKAEDVVFDLLADGAEVNLYALWDAVTWKVSFANPDTTAGTISPTDALEIVHGATVGAGNEPAATPVAGKVFLNWSYEMQIDANGTTRRGTVLAGEMTGFEVIGAVTFTAKWGPSSITVMYDPGKHGAFAANSEGYTYFSDIQYGAQYDSGYGQGHYGYNGGIDDATTNALNAGNPMGEAGWVFAYWSWYDEDGVYRTSLGSQYPATLAASYTFVAHWKPGGYTLTFDTNGGYPLDSDALEPQPMVTGQQFTLPDATSVARTGYYFRGWGSNAEGPAEYLGGDVITMKAEDLLLFAQWEPYRFTLHFDTQGGSPIDDSVGLTWDGQYLLKDQADANYLGAIAKAADVETAKPGYEFAGWFASLDDMAFPHLAVTNLDVLGVLFADAAGADGPQDGQEFTLYAKWTPKTATIHYIPVYAEGIGGTEALDNKGAQVQPDMAETVQAALGDATEHVAVAGPGYAFMYWAAADGAVLSYDAAFTPTKGAYDPDNGDFDIWADDTWYYAVFDIVRYTIAFDANGGTGSIAPMDMEYGTAQNLTSNANGLIYWPGYAFLGWNTEPDGTGANYADGANVNNLTTVMGDTVVLYARWQKADQQLKFFANYTGYAGGDSPKTYDVIEGMQVRLPNDTLFARSHYRLAAWNTAADGSGASYAPGASFTVPGIQADTNGDRVMDFYAIWQGVPYMVHFVANAADATGTMADQALEYGTQERLTPNVFARQGYTFLGWNAAADGTGTDYADGALVLNLTDVEGDIVQLYAVWTPNANKVSFVNGDVTYGKVVAYDQNVLTGGNAIYNASTVAVKPAHGHVLAGWAYEVYADADDSVLDSGMVMDPSTLTITGRTVFTAHWSYPYAVQYLPGVWGDFAAWTSEPQWVGAVVPTPPASILDANGVPLSKSVSYEFAGWKDQNGDTYGSYEAIRNALSMTEEGWIFEAQWNAIQAELSFHANGGAWADGVGPADVTDKLHGETITLPAADVLAARAGYTFDGWSTAPDGAMEYAPGSTFTMDVDVKVLYAHWVAKSYSVYYDMGNGPAIAHAIGVGWDDYVAAVGAGWTDGSFYADHEFLGWAADSDPAAVVVGLDAASLRSNGMKLGALFAHLGISNDDPQSVTIHAVWDLRDVTITYHSRDYNGDLKIVGYDSGSNGFVTETFKADGTPRGVTVAPREGYNFIGWYDGPGFDEDGNAVAATLLSTDTTWVPGKAGLTYWTDASYWAWYAPYTYTVKFDANDPAATAASAGMADQTMSYDTWEKLTERNLQIINPGHTFVGWALNSAGTGRLLNDGQMVLNLSSVDGGVVTLYAVWKYGDYVIEFDKNADDAGGATESQAMRYGAAANLNENGFWRNGYKFLGWSENEFAKIADYADQASFSLASGAPESTLTLYAVWAIADDYVIEFAVAEGDAAKGSIADDVACTTPLTRTVTFWQPVTWGDFTVTPAAGYAFSGWDIVYYTHAAGADIPHYETIESHDPYSISEYVVKGFSTVATSKWEQMFKVTYSPGDHGGFSAWESAYALAGALVPTYGSDMLPADLEAALWYAGDADPFRQKAMKSTDADTWVFKGWQDLSPGGKFYATWNDLEGLLFSDHDVQLVAQWVAAEQNITYFWSGVSPTPAPANPVAHKARTAATLYDSDDVTSLYFVLAGWATSADGDIAYAPGQQILMPTEGLALYAVWSEKTVTIRYKVRTDSIDMGTISGHGLSKESDGTLYQEVGIQTGKVYGINADGQRYVIAESPLPVYSNANPGYEFVSWMTDDTAAAEVKYGSSPFVIWAGDAGFEPATYWAKFRQADAVRIGYLVAIDGAESLSEDVKASDAGWVTLVEEYVDRATGVANGATAIAYNGWEFVGWYDEDGHFLSAETTYVPEKPGATWPHDGLTFVAHFATSEQMKYTVEHWIEGVDGTYALPADPAYTEILTAPYGSKVTGAPKSLVGYTYDAAASRTTSSATLSGTANTTLVLYYARDRYTVAYRYDGGKPTGAVVAPDAIAYRWGETVTVEDVPSFAGYTFTGWTLADGSTVVAIALDGTFTMPQGDVTFVGVWEADEVTLSFDPNGGAFATDANGNLVESVRPKKLVAGTSFALPTADDVSWDGRVLVGWATDPAGPLEFTPGQDVYMPYDLPSVKRTLYAIWREKLVKVQFDYTTKLVNEMASPPDGGVVVNYAGGNLIMDDGKLSMLVGAVSGNVYGYYNSTQVEASAPYEAKAQAKSGFYLLEWLDADGVSRETSTVFTLKRDASGLFVDQVYTVVFQEQQAVCLEFSMITEEGGAVNSPDISLDPATMLHQSPAPVSGQAVPVTVIDNQAADGKVYEFVGWYTGQVGGTLTLIGTDIRLDPPRNASGAYEPTNYYAVFHYKMAGQASYKVRHFLQETDGSYPATPYSEQVLWGNVSDDALATAMSIPGFTLEATSNLNGGSIPNVTGASDIVIDLRYERNEHTVSYAYNVTQPAGAPALPSSFKARFGTAQTADAAGVLPGYTFIGWTSADVTLVDDGTGMLTFEMPDADVELTGYFEAKTYWVEFTADAAEATVGGAGAEQHAKFGTTVAMTDPSSGAAWVVVTPAAGNAKVQYGWTYSMTDEAGNVLASDVFVVDPATLSVGGNMTFTANFIDGFAVTYTPGDYGDFAQGAGLTVFTGLTPADAIAKRAAYNSATTADGDPVGKPGYAFVAWQWADPATGVLLRSDVSPLPAFADAGYEFEALWVATARVLTFNVNGGTWTADPNGAASAGQLRDIGGTEPLPGDPNDPDALATRKGYRLAGFGTSAAGPVQWALGDDFTMPAVDTELFVVWSEISGINIYYIADGGGTVSLPTEQVSAVSGGAAGSVATPKSGRMFKEWALVDPANGDAVIQKLASGATLVPDASQLPGGLFAEGMTFKAFFEEGELVTINYQVSILDIDGTPLVVTPTSGGYVLLDSETIAPVSGTPTGTTALARTVTDPKTDAVSNYRLLYWVDPDGKVVGVDTSSAVVTAGSIMPQRNADGAYESTTYTAVFQKINEVIIRLDPNADDASVAPAGVREEAGASADPSTWVTSATRPGYTLAGWSTSATATTPDAGLAVGSTSWTVPAVNTTLYAVWTPNPEATLTLDAGEGAFADTSHTHDFKGPGGSIVAVADLPEPTRAGYDFLGWTATQGNATPDTGYGKGEGGTITMAAGTLHAVWQARTDTAYTIEYYKVVGTNAPVKFDETSDVGTTGAHVNALAHAYTVALGVPAGYALRAGAVEGDIAGDGSLVLMVYFDAQQHTLTVHLDGGTLGAGVADPAGTYLTDETVTLPAAGGISKDGYSFVKWALSWIDDAIVRHQVDYDPAVAGQGSFAMPGYDAVLHAIWEANTDTAYTIEYYTVVGTAVSATPFSTFNGTGATDDAVNALAHPHTATLIVPAGFALSANQPDSAGTITADGKLLLKVYFDALQHEVLFNANFGTLDGSVTNPVTAFTGQSVALPTADDMAAPFGKHLVGWWTTATPADGDALYVTTFTVGATDAELFAIWADNDPATAVLIAGDGVFANGLNSAAHKAIEGTLVLVADMPTPTRAGYDFLGWTATQGNGSPDQNLAVGDTWTMAAGTFYAAWQARTDTAYKIEYYKVVDGTVAAGPFDTYSGTDGTSGAVLDAMGHAYTTGATAPSLAVPAGYTMRAAAGQTDATGTIAGDGSTVLKVYLDADEQAVAVDLDGGTLAGGFPLPAKYYTDLAVPLPDKGDIAKAGYELAGWTVTWTDGAGVAHTEQVAPGGTLSVPAANASGISVKADWNSTMSSYTVNHVRRFTGGTATELAVVLQAPTGTAVSLANGDFALIAIAGHTYDANSVSSGTVLADGSLVIDLYYDASAHTVTYDLGVADAMWDGHETLPYVVNAWIGKTVTVEGASPAPARAGYSFGGWTRTAGADVADADLAPGSSFTLADADYLFYAVWDAYNVALAFAGSDAATPYLDETPVTGSMEDVAAKVGETATLPALGFSRPGYTFDGWYVADDAGDPKTLFNGTFTVPAVDHDGATVTLVAAWTPKEYTVNYYAQTDATGGQAALVDSRTFRWGELDAARMCFDPGKRTGYLFSNWYTFATGKRAKVTGKKTYAALVKNDESILSIDAYDDWSPRVYTVVYDSDGGTGVDSRTFTWDDTGLNLDATRNPVRDGYTFVEWRTKPNGRGAAMKDGTTLSYLWGKLKLAEEDEVGTLFASWDPLEFTVRYDTAGGGNVDDRRVFWSDTGFAGLVPVRDGYAFAGWFTADGTAADAGTAYCELVAAPDTGYVLVLYAKWNLAMSGAAAAVAGTTGSASSMSLGVAVCAAVQASADGAGSAGGIPQPDNVTHVADAGSFAVQATMPTPVSMAAAALVSPAGALQSAVDAVVAAVGALAPTCENDDATCTVGRGVVAEAADAVVAKLEEM